MERLSIFPNPVRRGEIAKIFFNKRSFNLSILNAVGVILLEKNNIDTEYSLDICCLKEGLYFLKVSDKENSIVTKLLILD